MKHTRTKVDYLKDSKAAKGKELKHVQTYAKAKLSDKGKHFQKLINGRIELVSDLISHLDPASEDLPIVYASLQRVKDEYQYLLDLLDDPEKRVEKVMLEIDGISSEIDRLKKSGETSGQY